MSGNIQELSLHYLFLYRDIVTLKVGKRGPLKMAEKIGKSRWAAKKTAFYNLLCIFLISG